MHKKNITIVIYKRSIKYMDLFSATDYDRILQTTGNNCISMLNVFMLVKKQNLFRRIP